MPSSLLRLTAGGLTGALLLVAAPVTSTAAPAPPASAPSVSASHDRKLPPGRRIRKYTVRPGDTATELAVRFHAWTDELIRINHLGSSATLYVGQRLRIPVVVAAVRKERKKKQHKVRNPPANSHHWSYADPSRAVVRRTIIRTARRHGVDPELALAVSWQEAGWQMHHVSSADAIGAMQVIPGTGVWMSMYAGRPLRLHRLGDNVLAGVLLLRVLDDHTRRTRHQVAAYYQGLGALQRHGMYAESRRYVANVLALKRRLEHGWNPARRR